MHVWLRQRNGPVPLREERGRSCSRRVLPPSEPWAGAGYSQVTFVFAGEVVDGVTVEADEQWPDGQAGLFHHINGSWTLLDRQAHCDDPEIPAPVWERACNVD